MDLDGASLSAVKLIVMDVDGVLTDVSIFLDSAGSEYKQFNAKDGLGLSRWRDAGGLTAIITGRSSLVVEARARELRIDRLVQRSRDKGADLRAVCESLNVRLEDTVMVGDDLPDLPAFALCGLSIAVADAVDEVRAAAKWVTQARGGHGALREVTDRLLKARGAQLP
ncbi:MAG: HAD hydrolase family protein [Planctomycetota bacterium]|nr:HAD hydrolase family protein [Planctomycetota bacterium]